VSNHDTYLSAVAAQRAGRHSEAETLYRRILAVHPAAEVYNNLGIALAAQDRLFEALNAYKQAIASNPDFADAWNNLGSTLCAAGQLNESIEACRRAIRLKPSFAEAYYNLGNALRVSNQQEQAVTAYQRAIALRPGGWPAAQNNLGLSQHALARFDEAIASFRQAITLQDQFPQALSNLGNVLLAAGRFDEAAESYRKSLALRSDHAVTWCNLGIALRQKGDGTGAVSAFQQSLASEPQLIEALIGLGDVFLEYGNADEAIDAYRRALAINPNDAIACNGLGYALMNTKGELDEAISLFRHAIDVDPNFVITYRNLGDALRHIGKTAQAVECYRQGPADPHVASHLLHAIHLLPNYDRRQIFEEHARWNERYARPLASEIVPHRNDPSPDRRLRVGYVAVALRNHPVGRFLLPLFENHDHAQFEVRCYCDDARSVDEVSDALRRKADVWRVTHGMSDRDVADLVRRDEVDILVDLVAHAGQHRLLTFARKPAPVQVTYLAYASTTGLETMDYRLTDPYLDPPEYGDAFYSEKSVRLPQTYWCYPKPGEAPAVGPPPASISRQITFGCLNVFSKVTEQALDCWSEVLRAVPNSRLMLHCNAGSGRDYASARFASHGIAQSRISFVGHVSLEAYFKLYQQIDIALDPFPHAGGTTTCDALWMGVPVVTLVGQTAVSRGGLSILSNLGLPELAAETLENYVKVAVRLANDGTRLEGLRSTLRDRMFNSPLTDAAGFARDVEAAYRSMWKQWGMAQRRLS
jgi:protein O-GlcNAc transferase